MSGSRTTFRLAAAAALAAVMVGGAGCRMFEAPPAPKPIPVLAWSLDELGKADPYCDSRWPNLTQFYWLTQGNRKDVAGAKRMTDRQPPGRRVIFSWDVHRLAVQNPADQLTTAAGEKFLAYWWDHGMADAEKAFDDFFREYRDLGGRLDFFVLDSEMAAGSDINTPARWAAVAKDPRFAAILEDLGATSAAEFDGPNKPLAHAYWRYQNWMSWRQMDRLAAIVLKYFPRANVSDYAGHNRLTDLVAWGRFAFDVPAPGQFGGHVGTHQAPSLYGVITYLGDVTVDGKKFGLGPFRSLMLAVNQGRASALYTPPVPLNLWLAWRGYRTDYEDRPAGDPPRSTFGNTDYYQELVFHAALLGPDAILLWSATRWRQDQKAEDWCQPEHLELVDRMMTQINALIGYADRKTLVAALSPWHAPFLLSGCVANGQSVWRLTPDPDQAQVRLAAIVRSEDPLTFRLGNQTLTMPGGKVFRPEPQLSSVGWWIVGPPDLRPQVSGN